MMLTRCPACQTVFRLSPEQLNARRGEVRCGHCFHPFNAREHEIRPREALASPRSPRLTFPEIETAAPSPAPAPAEPIRPPVADDPVQTQPVSLTDLDFVIPDFPGLTPTRDRFDPEPLDTDADASRAQPTATLPEVLRSGRRAAPAESAGQGEQPSTSEANPAVEEAPPDAAALSAADVRAEPLSPGNEAEIVAPEPATAPPEPVVPADIKPAHIDIARLDARYGRPPKPASAAVRTLEGLTVGLLAGLLLVQGTYLYRTEIARELPGLRPILTTACAQLGCDVPYPRNAESIGLDASDLQSEPGRPGNYVLHATVNNRADYAQTWPHLELTLTDARDMPIARRTLAPDEWVPAAQRVEAFAGRRAVNARIRFEAPDLAPTGYRVYVFYP